ncbi:MAG: GH92 family glycosyl hydrolase [Bacteroidota bacterium]|nr:GH92 family glycosyl hydrolase [Candidatus Kapabacteria bacterium]MDW8219342.1 GH92 family glycosyl hydrolase [Bacteroidota bacterium]
MSFSSLSQCACRIFALLLSGTLVAQNHRSASQQHKYDILRYVQPLIGTAGHGHTYPGATAPFGMIQLSPDNGIEGWDWCSGYHYSDSIIAGFSHTHISGTGIGDFLDISIMPININTPDDRPNLASVRWVGGKDTARYGTRQDGARRLTDWCAQFSHTNETATAGYYRVQFADSSFGKPSPARGITAELTASELVGVHRYTFPNSIRAGIVLDLSFAVNWDNTTDAFLRVRSNTLVSGYRFSTGWARAQRVFFAIEFSRPCVVWQGLRDSATIQDMPRELQGKNTRAFFEFTNQSLAPLTIKVGLSSVSEEAALAALQDVQGKSFDTIRDATQAAWRKELQKIRLFDVADSIQTMFVTALYHTFLAPMRFSDAHGTYQESRFNFVFTNPKTTFFPVKRTRTIRYDVFSLWDTFRAVHPLFTLVQQERVRDMLLSLLDHYYSFGVLPVWSLWGTETKTMTGYNAVPVLADAIRKGFLSKREAEQAYRAMKASANEDTLCVNLYRQYGFVPHDKDGFSVTKTLEFAFADWCIAETARLLGKSNDEREFRKRSQYWRNVLDTATRFMRARLSDSSWKLPFDPLYSDHSFDAEYTEGNAWHYAWFVPHDIEGLIQAYGGTQSFIRKLDTLFTLDEPVRGTNSSVDISGLLGQYAHGNEPSHHIAHLYTYAGKPSRTHERTRHIIQKLYSAHPDGLCGNDDCGQMSAWLVWNMVGLYPVNPASAEYALTSPYAPKAEIQVGRGRTFTILAHRTSETHRYIASARLNGKPLTRPFLKHSDIVRGGILELQMSNQPHTPWERTQ